MKCLAMIYQHQTNFWTSHSWKPLFGDISRVNSPGILANYAPQTNIKTLSTFSFGK